MHITDKNSIEDIEVLRDGTNPGTNHWIIYTQLIDTMLENKRLWKCMEKVLSNVPINNLHEWGIYRAFERRGNPDVFHTRFAHDTVFARLILETPAEYRVHLANVIVQVCDICETEKCKLDKS